MDLELLILHRVESSADVGSVRNVEAAASARQQNFISVWARRLWRGAPRLREELNRRIMFVWEGFRGKGKEERKKKKEPARLWMKHQVVSPFVRVRLCACSLRTQGPPFMNEFPERQPRSRSHRCAQRARARWCASAHVCLQRKQLMEQKRRETGSREIEIKKLQLQF